MRDCDLSSLEIKRAAAEGVPKIKVVCRVGTASLIVPPFAIAHRPGAVTTIDGSGEPVSRLQSRMRYGSCAPEIRRICQTAEARASVRACVMGAGDLGGLGAIWVGTTCG